MLDQIKLLGSRRAYEFRADDLRLTLLSIAPVQELIKQSFQFQQAALGIPLQTFGPVQPTIPPGLVFDVGFWVAPEGALVPIRFLHIESRRIVIDVAGPSSAIDAIYQRLRDVLAQIQAPDGSPALGEPESVLDYSEITARFSYSLDALFHPKLRELFAGVMKIGDSKHAAILAPTAYLQVQPITEEAFGGVSSADSRILQIAMRKGTHPEERIYFSGAPLDSEEHLAYLTALDAILTAPE